MLLPTNKVESLRLLKRTAIGASALIPQTIVFGNVVRVRAQYLPKVVQLDPEDGKDIMGVSYMQMLKRVIRLEGWKGLLRGIVPLAIATVFALLFCPPLSYKCTLVPFYLVLDVVLRYCILVLFDVPFTIFFVRSITSPEMAPFFGIRRAVRTLFSATERRRPWLLYLTPGLFIVTAFDRAWDVLLIPALTKLVARHVPLALFTNGMTLQTLARLSLAIFHAAVLGPVEVIKVRLAVQRHEQPVVLPEGTATQRGDGSDVGDITNSMEPSDAVTGGARVVRLRTESEQPAYTSLFDCVRSIIVEEGFGTFYRAWWFTLLLAMIKVGIVQV